MPQVLLSAGLDPPDWAPPPGAAAKFARLEGALAVMLLDPAALSAAGKLRLCSGLARAATAAAAAGDGELKAAMLAFLVRTLEWLPRGAAGDPAEDLWVLDAVADVLDVAEAGGEGLDLARLGPPVQRVLLALAFDAAAPSSGHGAGLRPVLLQVQRARRLGGAGGMGTAPAQLLGAFSDVPPADQELLLVTACNTFAANARRAGESGGGQVRVRRMLAAGPPGTDG